MKYLLESEVRWELEKKYVRQKVSKYAMCLMMGLAAYTMLEVIQYPSMVTPIIITLN